MSYIAIALFFLIILIIVLWIVGAFGPSPLGLNPIIPSPPLNAIPPGCTSVGDLINTQFKGLLPFLNLALLGAPLNVSFGDFGIRGGPIQINSLFLDPNDSYICSQYASTPNITMLKGRIQLSSNPLTVQLFAPVNFSQFSATGSFQAMLEAGNTDFRRSQVAVTNLTFAGTPSSPYNDGAIALLNSSPINGLLSQSLTSFIQGRLGFGEMPPLQGGPYDAQISAFLTTQINAALQTPGAQGGLRNLVPGPSAFREDSGCDPDFRIGGVCFSCSWYYRVGVNSIQGLENMRVENITFGTPTYNDRSREYKIPFSLQASVTGASVYVTARLQPCIKGTEFGPNNTRVPIAGKTTIWADGYITGTYFPSMGGVYFSTKGIVLQSMGININLPTDWMNIPSALNVIIDTLLPLPRVVVQATLDYAARTAIPIIKESLQHYLFWDANQAITLPFVPS